MIDPFFASSFAKASDDKKATDDKKASHFARPSLEATERRSKASRDETKGKEKMGKRFLWLAFLGGLGGIGYLAANAWGKFMGATDVRLAFENHIPFAPNAIIIYLLIFPFLLTPVFLVKKYSDFVLVVGTYTLLVFVSVAIFFQFPTTMARPDAPVHGFVGWLFGIIRMADGPNNLFPSLHVSSVVFAALVNGFFCPKAKGPSWVCAALISVSTLLVKQHAVVDVLGGGVFGVSAYILMRVLRR